MLFVPAVPIRTGTSLINTLRNLSLTTNLQGCYDFADINCYSGSGQTINDLSGQGNGLFLGTSASDTTFDPTFSGTAGNLTANELFPCGGKVIGGTQPSWMQAVHKASGKITIIQWTRTTVGSYSMGGVFTNEKNDVSGNQYPGWTFGVSAGPVVPIGRPNFAVQNDAGSTVAIFSGTSVVSGGQWMFSACAIDAQAGTALIQIDDTQYTGSISYSSPSTSNSPNNLLLSPSAATAHDKAQLAFWNSALSAANVGAIYNSTKARFGF